MPGYSKCLGRHESFNSTTEPLRRPSIPIQFATPVREQVATIITLDGHQVSQVTYSLTLKDQLGNADTASGTSYDLGANDFLYTITLTGTSPDLSTIVTTFHAQ
jgi:hypothetical protein